jgi:hypothetical protein
VRRLRVRAAPSGWERKITEYDCRVWRNGDDIPGGIVVQDRRGNLHPEPWDNHGRPWINRDLGDLVEIVREPAWADFEPGDPEPQDWVPRLGADLRANSRPDRATVVEDVLAVLPGTYRAQARAYFIGRQRSGSRGQHRPVESLLLREDGLPLQ